MRLQCVLRQIVHRNRTACVGAALALFVLTPALSFAQAGSFAPAVGAAAQSGGDQGTSAAGAQPKYPGIGPAGGDKVEGDLGAFKFRLFGTVLLNTAVSDAAI